MSFNKDSRTKNAGRNALSAFINKIVILFLTFVSRKFFIDYIGVEYFGINGLFSNILTLLAMADLGLGTAMNVSLYKPIAEQDTRKISALLNYFRKIYYGIAGAVTLIGLSLIPFLGYLVNLDKGIPYLEVYYSIFVLRSAVSYLFVYKASIVRADQKNYLVNRIDIHVNLIKTVLKIISIITLKSFLVYILLDVAGVLAHNIIVSRIANKQYPFIKKVELLDKEEKKTIFSDISSIFLYKISWCLLNGSTNILMSILVGTIFVGLYSNYHTITINLETFIALFFTSLTPSIGNLVATSSPEKRFAAFRTMQMVSFCICGIVCVCVFNLTQDFIELWFGKDLLLDRLTLFAITLNLFFSTCMRPVWTFREGTGMYRQIRYIMFVTAILNILLSIVLGKWLGVSGIIFAISISKFATYFWYEPNILFKKFFNRKVRYYYLDYAANIAILIAGGYFCTWVISHLFSDISVLNWFLKALFCIGIMSTIYFFRYFRTIECKNLISKIRNSRKK